ncbi:MAG: alanine--tRNA ligase [Candidatus Taylorbacteria bacterium]|nr:alanine--tRNA ligase [Candidatus Taylorbacteria bacterium]
MTSAEVRRRFLAFFEKRGHAIIPSAPLVPENDPTVLFNTAGMQPLVPYLMGRPHPQGDRLADVQKCVRTGDIDDIGDNRHLTFFEMLGNWSLGSYFKEEAIKWSYELLTSKTEGFGLDPKRLYVTVFAGDENAPRDEEAKKAWVSAGVPENRIYFKDASANWWPAVKGKDAWTGPTGPCSEMFYDITKSGLGDMTPAEYDKADDEGRVIEIWNDVFMEFEKKDGKIVSKLAKRNVDTGAGLERLATVLQKKTNVFETDVFLPIIDLIRKNSKNYDERSARIVADHLRTATFLISDGVVPSNKDQGYVLRRILRRAVFKMGHLMLPADIGLEIVEKYVNAYQTHYPNLNGETVKTVLRKEEVRFKATLDQGLKELKKTFPSLTSFGDAGPEKKIKLDGRFFLDLFTTYGFPFELAIEIIQSERVQTPFVLSSEKIGELKTQFDEEFKKHQDLSRAGAEAKFKGGLGDTSEMSLKYHTATHLLHKALHEVLGDHVSQKGSNITPERLRFDFTHGAKMTDEEKKRVEDIVNAKIKAALPVHRVELPKDEALKTGAYHFFGDKYGDVVSVYYIGDSIDSAYSKEFCGGPHVENTSALGSFKIQKEEAVSAGVRRIKAVLS